MSNQPIITIGLPVYNSERYLEQSLQSLLGQTYDNFTLIISDNASTDGTADICRRYADADRRIQYHRNEKNIGNPRNFNRVFELTKTPYLKWSTADDYWDAGFLERAIKVMEGDDSIILCYPKTILVDANGHNQKPYEDKLHLVQDEPAERFISLLKNIGLSHQHLGLMRTDYVRKTHLLGTHVASDINLLAEMTLYGKFFELPERMFFRRFHEKSGSWRRGDMQHEALLYHAEGTTFAGFKSWRSHLWHFKAVRKSPLKMRSKVRIYHYLARRIKWNRKALIGEVSDYIGHMARSIGRKTSRQ